MMKRLAVRVPEETVVEIQEMAEHEKLDKATAVRALLLRGIDDWKKETAMKLLQEGKVTFAKGTIGAITRLLLVLRITFG